MKVFIKPYLGTTRNGKRKIYVNFISMKRLEMIGALSTKYFGITSNNADLR